MPARLGPKRPLQTPLQHLILSRIQITFLTTTRTALRLNKPPTTVLPRTLKVWTCVSTPSVDTPNSDRAFDDCTSNYPYDQSYPSKYDSGVSRSSFITSRMSNYLSSPFSSRPIGLRYPSFDESSAYSHYNSKYAPLPPPLQRSPSIDHTYDSYENEDYNPRGSLDNFHYRQSPQLGMVPSQTFDGLEMSKQGLYSVYDSFGAKPMDSSYGDPLYPTYTPEKSSSPEWSQPSSLLSVDNNEKKSEEFEVVEEPTALSVCFSFLEESPSWIFITTTTTTLYWAKTPWRRPISPFFKKKDVFTAWTITMYVFGGRNYSLGWEGPLCPYAMPHALLLSSLSLQMYSL